MNINISIIMAIEKIKLAKGEKEIKSLEIAKWGLLTKTILLFVITNMRLIVFTSKRDKITEFNDFEIKEVKGIDYSVGRRRISLLIIGVILFAIGLLFLHIILSVSGLHSSRSLPSYYFLLMILLIIIGLDLILVGIRRSVRFTIKTNSFSYPFVSGKGRVATLAWRGNRKSVPLYTGWFFKITTEGETNIRRISPLIIDVMAGTYIAEKSKSVETTERDEDDEDDEN